MPQALASGSALLGVHDRVYDIVGRLEHFHVHVLMTHFSEKGIIATGYVKLVLLEEAISQPMIVPKRCVRLGHLGYFRPDRDDFAEVGH